MELQLSSPAGHEAFGPEAHHQDEQQAEQQQAVVREEPQLLGQELEDHRPHQDVSVTPDQYIFLESAFLLAAIVLGGMGTIVGVLVGAVILKLLPEKLRFFADYRLLLFGLLLVLMMRFRPEGLMASRRRQLEFHEEDEELAVRVEGDIAEEAQG